MSDSAVPTTPNPLTTMMTDRAGSPPEGAVINPDDSSKPNVIITLMTPLAQVVVRGLRTYIQGVVGFLLLVLASRPSAEALGIVVPPGDFLVALQVAAGLALAPTIISILQNTAELLAKFDAMFPKSRA